MKKLRITVDGRVFDVQVELLDEPAGSTPPAARVAAAPSAPVAAVAATPAPRAAPAAGANDVMSPLAGKVVSIDVKVGQAVAAGAQVATIEAMKMNTYIYAAAAGRVSEIVANAGDAVEEGALLVRLG